MKYLKKHFFLFLTFVSPLGLFAQEEEEIDYATATITTELCVSLDTDSPLSENYIIDISHLHFATEKEAKEKIGYIENNLLTYIVDFSAEKVHLIVHTDRLPIPHDVIWWDAYIDSLCGL